ncbi:MAG TPA: hypothetical protein VLF66_08220, partial [Thermoanaerobaculia bacterium]|nr:hypothetical protein [Thermoanaerobaculia bacterium]
RDLSDGITEPLNLYSFPAYLKMSMRRFQRKVYLTTAIQLSQSKILGAALQHGFESLRQTPESQQFLSVLEKAESLETVSLADEVVLDRAINGFKFTPADPNSGFERWTVRVGEGVKKDLYSTRSLLRIEVSPLAAVCLGKGLANQLGVNPEASELMIETYNSLRAALRKRAAHLDRLVALLAGKE